MPKPNNIDGLRLVIVIALMVMTVGIFDNLNQKALSAEKITAVIFDEHTISFANNGVINENKLKQIQNMNYNEFKNSLNAKNDFCIYLEDENGNIILSKGSDKLNKDGIVCRE